MRTFVVHAEYPGLMLMACTALDEYNVYGLNGNLPNPLALLPKKKNNVVPTLVSLSAVRPCLDWKVENKKWLK